MYCYELISEHDEFRSIVSMKDRAGEFSRSSLHERDKNKSFRIFPTHASVPTWNKLSESFRAKRERKKKKGTPETHHQRIPQRSNSSEQQQQRVYTRYRGNTQGRAHLIWLFLLGRYYIRCALAGVALGRDRTGPGNSARVDLDKPRGAKAHRPGLLVIQAGCAAPR